MPDDAEILGFTNRWYAKGMETAITCALTGELNIKRLTPTLFVATKLDAYLGRGKGDLLASRDMEDILLLIDGRREFAAEVQAADDDIREFIAEQFAALLEERDFDYFLDGNIRGPAGRSDIVRQRFVDISRNGRR
jgi:hypothetical protein